MNQFQKPSLEAIKRNCPKWENCELIQLENYHNCPRRNSTEAECDLLKLSQGDISIAAYLATQRR